MALSTEDVVFAAPDGVELQARIYRDPDTALGEGIVSVHGGAWTKNDRTTAVGLDSALAAAGLTVAALDFRQGPAHQYPAASQDVAAGIRYLRANAEALGVHPDGIGLVGSSSGGQTALLAGLTPNAARHRGTPIRCPDGEFRQCDDISAAVRYVAALWPVSDPLGRYQYAREIGRTELLKAHESYFGDTSRMHDASIQRILGDGEAESFPPIWVAQPGADKNVPPSMTIALLEAYQAIGGELEYAFYPGQPHAFLYEDTPETSRCLEAVKSFILRQLAR